ncbi:Spartin [Merluccius polli]|uniref:Spartin n=1 Tax=Merluccius polli TaxID=89951 RepID=A0AA47NRZ3_MERPO|nr:Spartin [Merluccius polli]
MAHQPAELLLVKDQYELAFHCLTQGLTAEEAGRRNEGLDYYRRGRQHLTQGLEIPTDGERHRGPHWDAARGLQQKMGLVLRNLSLHLVDLETTKQTTPSQRSRVSMDPLPDGVDPTPAPQQRHLYPSIPAGLSQTSAAPELVVPVQGGFSISDLPSLPPRHSQMPPPVVLFGDQPPAYTPRPTEGHQSLAGVLGGVLRGQGAGALCGRVGRELIFIPAGVQMFFVAPDGQVSSLFQPGYLRIFSCEEESSPTATSKEKHSSAFLHVCDWLYPLAADTPVLLANSGIYMFPDMLRASAGSYVGIVLSTELPRADRQLFNDVLAQLVELRVQVQVEGEGSEVINLSEKVPLGTVKDETQVIVTEEEKLLLPEWSEKMAQHILSGASWLGKEFVRGAEATGKAIHKGATKLRSNITPEETPAEISPKVTKGLQVAQQATGGAARVSQFLVNGVSTVAGAVGERLAPHVKKHGAKLIPESMKKSKDGQASNMDGAKLVAASSIQGRADLDPRLEQGVSTVWTALETGAKTVGKSVASETVMTAKYKYGDEAGKATGTAVQSVINVGVAAYNFDDLAFKAIMKTTGKATAKAMVKKPGEENGPGKGEEDAEEMNESKEKTD